MLECQGCHRYVHATESSCPFCAAPLALTSAASLARRPLVALAAGLSLLACTESGDDSADGNTVTTDPSTSESTSTSGDGDGDTQETTGYTDYSDYSGSDYGGSPPCDELVNSIPISVGSNPVDTSMSVNNFSTECGDQTGTGPDELLEFVSPAAGHFTFTLTSANFDAWLLRSGYYCDTYGGVECMPNQGFDIEMIEGDTLFLILDGTASGTASVDVTQG
jgi:hypothetical protein